MKYVVTGGAGFIGSHIAEKLVDLGHEVVILDNLFSGKIENIQHLLENDRVRFINGSIIDSKILSHTFEGVEGVFHEAAIASVPRSIRNPIATNEMNITGTLQVLLSAKDAGVKKVVFASSSSVYGDTPVLPKTESMKPNPKSPYAVSKLTGEHYCQVFSEIFSIQTVSLRYFNVFGPRQDPKSEYAAVVPKFITRVLHNEPPIIYGDGMQTRDFTFVKDVVQANIKAMTSNAEGVFNVAYNKRIDLIELATIIMDELGINLLLQFEEPRSGDIKDSLADITAARNAFGYEPKYSVKSGLRETLEWYTKKLQTK